MSGAWWLLVGMLISPAYRLLAMGYAGAAEVCRLWYRGLAWRKGYGLWLVRRGVMILTATPDKFEWRQIEGQWFLHVDVEGFRYEDHDPRRPSNR